MHPAFKIPGTALEITQPYLISKLEGNRREALRVAVEQGLEKGISVSELQLRMILPAQREIGRLWEENRITVAQEHLATSISQLVMAHLYGHLARAPANGKRVLVACVEGEQHDLGARMGADFLEMAGCEVHFLGANVATEQLLGRIEEGRPDLVGLSATMHFHLPALRRAIAAIRERQPTLPIMVGGGLLEAEPGLAEELGVQASGKAADELARLGTELLGGRVAPNLGERNGRDEQSACAEKGSST
jgi:MerR family transcriptional regulator, light-induced transcriptional regulator